MIKDNHIIRKELCHRRVPGCSEHDWGHSESFYYYHALCDGELRKPRKPCKSCLRIAAHIAKDAAALTEDKE